MPDRSGASALVPIACLTGAVLLWGTSFVAMKTALTGFGPMTVIWLRMAIGSLMMLPFWRLLPKPDYRRGDGWRLVAMCLCQPCLYFLLEANALRFTTASQAGVVSSIVPLLVAVGAWAFLRERMAARALVGLALSLLGVAVLSLGGAPAPRAADPLLGNSLELVAMVTAAAYMLLVKHLSDRYDPWFLTGLQSAVGALFFLPGAVAAGGFPWSGAPLAAWLATIFLGSVVTLGAFGLYNVAVCRMPAARAAVAINAVPLVALVTGWLVLGESMTLAQGAGCVVIAAGVALAQTGRREPVAVPEPVSA